MRSLTALIHREFLEHRGAFLYAPIVLTILFVIGTLMPFVSGHFHSFGGMRGGTASRFYEISYMFAIGAWWLYLLVTLFFYFADAFSADKRNNSMLFWKSMPVTDLKMLASKMAAGLTIFPALIFVAMLFAGIWAYVVAQMSATVLPSFIVPAIGPAIGAYVQVSLSALVFIILGLLWLAPFFAWVGALSTVAGRWSIPLAFLIPGVLILFENGTFRMAGAPDGGYIANFLRHRVDLGFAKDTVENFLITGQPFNAVEFTAGMIARIDWAQMVAGWAFAVIVIVLASEYRRRTLD
jgi:ABC-2 type transport system permease protein